MQFQEQSSAILHGFSLVAGYIKSWHPINVSVLAKHFVLWVVLVNVRFSSYSALMFTLAPRWTDSILEVIGQGSLQHHVGHICEHEKPPLTTGFDWSTFGKGKVTVTWNLVSTMLQLNLKVNWLNFGGQTSLLYYYIDLFLLLCTNLNSSRHTAEQKQH